MTEKFDRVEDAQSVEEFADAVSTEKAEESATQYIESTPSNPIKLLLLEPYLLLMFIFSPLPYQVHSLGQAISFLVESIPQFLIVLAAFKYLVFEKNKGTPQIKAYKTMGRWTLALFYFIFSLGTTCYGTAIRHRAKITPMLIVFAVMYYAEKKGAAVGNSKEKQMKRNKVPEIKDGNFPVAPVRPGNVPYPFIRRSQFRVSPGTTRLIKIFPGRRTNSK